MTKIMTRWRAPLLTVGPLLASALVQVLALNAFLIPSNIFASGFSGISQLLSVFSGDLLPQALPTGLFNIMFNVPIGIIGWKMIGGKFTILSLANALLTSLLQIALPVHGMTTDPLLAALFGGLILGLGVGIAMRYGSSTGGVDIIAMVVQKLTGKSLGVLMNAINLSIVLIVGSVIGWQHALFTIIGIYATSRVVDVVYTGYQKLTAMIVTSHGDAVVTALHERLIRGITVIPSRGAYTKRDSQTLMMVLSRYELFEMQESVHQADPKAFVNILSTVNVAGEFWDADRQLQMRQAAAVPNIDVIEAQIAAEERLQAQLTEIPDQTQTPQ